MQLHVSDPPKALKKLGTEMAVAQVKLLVSQASEVIVLVD